MEHKDIMELDWSDSKIEFKKILNGLDKFTIKFTKILNRLNIKYVIISGYVAILFGRNRSSEDIDIFIEKMDEEKFTVLWNEIMKEFDCINSGNPEEAYKEYISQDLALRFCEKEEVIPNMEVKFPRNKVCQWALDNAKMVLVNQNKIYISPIELQIAYKLLLGSNKDIEDAVFLFKLFKDKINMDELVSTKDNLNVSDELFRYIK